MPGEIVQVIAINLPIESTASHKTSSVWVEYKAAWQGLYSRIPSLMCCGAVGKYFDKQQRLYFWIPAFAAPSSASLWKQGRSWARNDRHKYTDTPLQWYHQISTVLRIANACASKHNLALQAKQATCHAARCNLLVAQEEPVAMSRMSTLDCERNVANKGQTSYT